MARRIKMSELSPGVQRLIKKVLQAEDRKRYAPVLASFLPHGREKMRSKLERAYADRLDLLVKLGEIRAWRYEPTKFHLANRCTYTPDFEVEMLDGKIEYHETKGWGREDAIIKLKMAARLNQDHVFKLVKRERSRWIIKIVKP